MTEQRVSIRLLVLETLLEADRGGRPSHLLLGDVLDKYSWLPDRDRAFFKRLFEGTLEYRLQLDYVIRQFSSVPPGKMKPVIREILCLSVYQILYMDSVPDPAAVNEGVKLAVRKGFGSLRGFVNGVLRAVSRGKDRIKWPEPPGSAEFLSVRYSVPEWLTERWISDYGPEKAEIICASFPEKQRITARVRTAGPADGGTESQESTDSLVRAPYLPEEACCFPDTGKVTELPAFREGRMVIQDVSSMLAVRAADIHPGSRVLDLCAAPGGKSIYAADLCRGDGGSVTARDLTAFKCRLLEENRERCRVDNMFIEQADAAVFRPEDEASFDVVLADLPCSGYGVIGRKPDIRYHASAQKERDLVQLQRKILRNAVRYVKPGGVLLYSTCTFHREENEGQAEWICREYSGRDPGGSGDPGICLQLSDLRPFLPEPLRSEPTAEKGYLQLFPGVHECDGFFIARFVRLPCSLTIQLSTH